MSSIPLIIGMGETGLSVAQYLFSRKLPFRVIDTRPTPPNYADFKTLLPESSIHIGSLNKQWLASAREIILSPGVDPKLLEGYLQADATLKSDIDLFQQECQAPIIAITGTNGKSTTALLVRDLLMASGKTVYAGGNLGIPALKLLAHPVPDFYILELSSFQLAITQMLRTELSVFLNLSIDHLDRHHTLSEYCRTKQKIYKNSRIALYNQNEPSTHPIYKTKQQSSFNLSTSINTQSFEFAVINQEKWLLKDSNCLLRVDSLVTDNIHPLNVLASLSILYSLIKDPLTLSIKQAFARFERPAHRQEKFFTFEKVVWINDSKSTNSHAAAAALSRFSQSTQKNIIWIAGGRRKVHDDFSQVLPLLKKSVKHCILIGEDRYSLGLLFQNQVNLSIAHNLEHAVLEASQLATPGSYVIFSPACSSQDMFNNYHARGQYFKELVIQHLDKKQAKQTVM